MQPTIFQRMFRYGIGIGIGICALLAVTCTSNNPLANSEAGNPTIITEALIDLPSSIADYHSSVVPLRKSNRSDKALHVYDHIRAQTWFVNQLINGDDNSVRHFFNNFIMKLDWKHIKTAGSVEIITDTVTLKASYTETDSFPYTVFMESKGGSEYFKVKTSFGGSDDYPKGYFYFMYRPVVKVTDSVQIMVHFSKTRNNRTCSVEITQKPLLDTASTAQKFKFLLQDTMGIIHISGTSHHPYSTDILPKVKGYCYTYTAVVDSAANKAKVNLGIAPDTVTDTTLLFSSDINGYSIAAIYGKYFINHDIAQLPDSVKQWIVTSYKDTLSLDIIFLKLLNDTNFTLHPANEIASMTIEDLKFFLYLNRNLDNDFKKLLWVLRISQPVYFYKNGYAGNGEAPFGFEALEKIACSQPKMKPLDVKNLVIVLPAAWK